MAAVVWFQGRFSPPEDAGIAVDDRGYLMGDGVFATLRGYAGRCFRTRTHLEGLARGADVLGLEVPISLVEIGALCDAAVGLSGERDAYVRVTLTRGGKLSILARALDVPHEDAYDHGVRAVTIATRRRPPLDPIVKTTSYAFEIVARREAEATGAAEGVQLAYDGAIAGGAMSNVFLVVKDALFTPSLDSGCRDGVTRRAVLELATGAGLTPRQDRLEPSVLQDADEIFFTSTRIECLPVATLDGRSVGTGAFPRTSALRALLRAEATR